MHFLERVYLFGAPTTVLLRSGMVRSRKPFYDESTWLVEDLSACFELLREWDFGFVHQVLTFVRTQNDDSIQFGRRSFETWMLDRFAVLIRHGRDFLDPSEYRATYRETRSLYYSRLAFGVIHRKGPEFWEYHRAALATVGARLERGRLARHVALEILRMASNPGQSLMALARYLKSAWRDRHGEAERAPQSPAGL
jgi:hypothetical protein